MTAKGVAYTRNAPVRLFPRDPDWQAGNLTLFSHWGVIYRGLKSKVGVGHHTVRMDKRRCGPRVLQLHVAYEVVFACVLLVTDLTRE